MYSSIIMAVAALVSTSSALAIRNTHVGDFRLYSHEGCSADNLGVWTVIDDDVRDHPCQRIPDDTNVRSVFVTDVADRCKFSLWEDADCTVGEQNTSQGNCYNSAAGWKAWKMTC